MTWRSSGCCCFHRSPHIFGKWEGDGLRNWEIFLLWVSSHQTPTGVQKLKTRSLLNTLLAENRNIKDTVLLWHQVKPPIKAKHSLHVSVPWYLTNHSSVNPSLGDWYTHTLMLCLFPFGDKFGDFFFSWQKQLFLIPTTSYLHSFKDFFLL